MIQILKKAIAVCSLVVLGGAMLYNCEPDPDALGEQLFLGDAAQGTQKSYDITAFNINNNDSIRSDAAKLRSEGVLGAFQEGQLGRQKASYVTQLRLFNYNPDFGTDPVVDSVVLVIKPVISDSLVTMPYENVPFVGTEGTVTAKKVVGTAPVVKFGKAKRNFTINVNEVTDFLKSPLDTVKSNQIFNYNSTILGSKEFKGLASSVVITKASDASPLFTAATPGIRIPLDKTFFQNKIIAKKGQPELQDASNFIRHIKGLRISVAENDGYLFRFYTNTMELIMYYKNGPAATRTSANYAFDLTSTNVHIGQYEYDRQGSAWQAALNSNATGSEGTGAAKLFAQGMGGPSIGVKFSKQTVDNLRKIKSENNAAIMGAKIRLFIDKSSWNTYANPTEFTILQRNLLTNKTKNQISLAFTKDFSAFAALGGFNQFTYNISGEVPYYDFVVTQSLKDLIEKQTGYENDGTFFRIDMGHLNRDETQNNIIIGPSSTSRVSDVQRAVFVGSAPTNPADPNRAQLIVTYGKK